MLILIHSGQLSQTLYSPPSSLAKMLLQAAVQVVGFINTVLLPALSIKTGQEESAILAADLLENSMENDWQYLFGLNLQGLWDSVTQSHFLFSPYRRIKCFIFFQKSLKLQNSLHSLLIICIFFSFSSLGSNYWWIYIFKRICIFSLVWNLICSCIKMSLLPREYSNKSQ